MNNTWRVTNPARRIGVGLVAAVAGMGLLMVDTTPAHAAASVSVSGVDGKAQASVDTPTTLQLSGSGFQSLQGGFGGIYVVFGTVKGSWRPSMGGVSGRDYLYVPDAQAKENAGYERFVAFPGSSTGHTANGGLVDANGNWSTTLVVPGPTFQATDSTGQSVTVDCRTTQCGVITIGAHAVVNAANETFTPVSFGGAAAAQSEAAAEASPEATGEVAAEGVPEAVGEAIPEGPVQLTLGIDATTAVAGHALTFTARGFHPGEQVVVVLDDGVITAGPLTAGRYGELAGIMPLDADLRVGTHVLKLTGAASQATVSAEVTVRRDPALVSAAEMAARQDAADEVQGLTALETAIVVAAGLLVLLVVFLLVSGAARRGRARRAQAQAQANAQALPAGPGADWKDKAAKAAKPAKPVKAAKPAKPAKRRSVADRPAPFAVPSGTEVVPQDDAPNPLGAAPDQGGLTDQDQPDQLTEDMPEVDADPTDRLASAATAPIEPPEHTDQAASTLEVTEELASHPQADTDQAEVEEGDAAASNGVMPAAEMMAQVKARIDSLRQAAEAEVTVPAASAETWPAQEPQELKA